MTYTVKEMFVTLQGEGVHSGRKALFIRFTGCNLWSGREADRATAVCQFCDTDFIGGKKYPDALALTEHAKSLMDSGFVVLTGGEPGLQVNAALIDELHARGFVVAIETNGTVALPSSIDWVCLSPKAGTVIAINKCDEIKIVYPQAVAPETYDGITASHRWVSPMDGPDLYANTVAAIAFCFANPDWRLNSQSHKQWGIA